MVEAIKAADAANTPMYSFHATDDPDADINAIRAELKEMYRQIEQTDWVNMPAGSVQMMMLVEQ